jgi:hypothetical protein
MVQDEIGTLATLNTSREIIQRQIAQHRRRIASVLPVGV